MAQSARTAGLSVLGIDAAQLARATGRAARASRRARPRRARRAGRHICSSRSRPPSRGRAARSDRRTRSPNARRKSASAVVAGGDGASVMAATRERSARSVIVRMHGMRVPDDEVARTRSRASGCCTIEHGAGRVPHDLLGDAAGEHVLDEAEMVLAHDDELDVELARARDDRVAGSRHAGGAQQILGARVPLVLAREQARRDRAARRCARPRAGSARSPGVRRRRATAPRARARSRARRRAPWRRARAAGTAWRRTAARTRRRIGPRFAMARRDSSGRGFEFRANTVPPFTACAFELPYARAGLRPCVPSAREYDAAMSDRYRAVRIAHATLHRRRRARARELRRRGAPLDRRRLRQRAPAAPRRRRRRVPVREPAPVRHRHGRGRRRRGVVAARDGQSVRARTASA